MYSILVNTFLLAMQFFILEKLIYNCKTLQDRELKLTLTLSWMFLTILVLVNSLTIFFTGNLFVFFGAVLAPPMILETTQNLISIGIAYWLYRNVSVCEEGFHD